MYVNLRETNYTAAISERQASDILYVVRRYYANPYTELDKIAKMAPLINEILGGGLVRELLCSNFLGDPPLLRLSGFPDSLFGELPNTPENDEVAYTKDYVSEIMMVVLSMIANYHLFQNISEKNGKMFQDVIPDLSKAYEISGSGFKKAFDPHTENVHQLVPPVAFILSCLKGDESAITGFVLVDQLLEEFTSAELQEMKKNQFRFHTGPSYPVPAHIDLPILTRPRFGHGYDLRFNAADGRVEGRTTEAKYIVERLRALLRDPNGVARIEVSLKAGDITFINNLKLLHYRLAFTPSTTNADRRWLQRVYLRR